MDTNARVAGRRKEIKKRAAEQVRMDNYSTGQHPCNCFQVSEFLQSRSLLSRFFSRPMGESLFTKFASLA